MSLLRNALAGAQQRAYDGAWGPYADGTIPPNSLATDGGRPVTEHTATHLVDAYACITLIADSLSMLPIANYRRSGNYRVPSPSSFIDQPDPELDQGVYFGQLGHSLAARGVAYSPILEFDRRGYPQTTRALHPDDVRPRRSKKTGQIEYELRNGDMVQRNAMLDIQLHPQPGQLVGLSPIDCARRTLRLAQNTEEFGNKWFDDGANPSSVLETEQEVDDTEAKRLQARWIASHGGRRRPAVMSSGLKWRPITITPNESQFLETRQLNTAATARIWRVPPHMIGDLTKTTSWGTGIEEQGIGYAVFTMGIYLTRIEQAFSSPRVSARDNYSKFNIAALLRGSTKDRFEAYALARQWGWMSVNDIRSLEDLSPVEGGDTYLQPLNMIDAEAAIAALKLKGAIDDGD